MAFHQWYHICCGCYSYSCYDCSIATTFMSSPTPVHRASHPHSHGPFVTQLLRVSTVDRYGSNIRTSHTNQCCCCGAHTPLVDDTPSLTVSSGGGGRIHTYLSEHLSVSMYAIFILVYIFAPHYSSTIHHCYYRPDCPHQGLRQKCYNMI